MTAERQLRLERIRLESMEHLGFGVQAMKRIKVCAKCGNPSPTNQQFCKECGSRLPDKTLYDEYKERHKICPNCDAVMHDESLYCSQCGTRLNAATMYTNRASGCIGRSLCL